MQKQYFILLLAVLEPWVDIAKKKIFVAVVSAEIEVKIACVLVHPLAVERGRGHM